MDGSQVQGVQGVVDAAFAKHNADVQAQQQSPQAKGLRFAVGIGILAYGIAKHNTYVTIVGGGFLAYWLVTGQLT